MNNLISEVVDRNSLRQINYGGDSFSQSCVRVLVNPRFRTDEVKLVVKTNMGQKTRLWACGELLALWEESRWESTESFLNKSRTVFSVKP